MKRFCIRFFKIIIWRSDVHLAFSGAFNCNRLSLFSCNHKTQGCYFGPETSACYHVTEVHAYCRSFSLVHRQLLFCEAIIPKVENENYSHGMNLELS